jgi:hypothetical protein
MNIINLLGKLTQEQIEEIVRKPINNFSHLGGTMYKFQHTGCDNLGVYVEKYKVLLFLNDKDEIVVDVLEYKM